MCGPFPGSLVSSQADGASPAEGEDIPPYSPESYSTAWMGLEHMIFLPQPSECQDDRNVPQSLSQSKPPLTHFSGGG